LLSHVRKLMIAKGSDTEDQAAMAQGLVASVPNSLLAQWKLAACQFCEIKGGLLQRMNLSSDEEAKLDAAFEDGHFDPYLPHVESTKPSLDDVMQKWSPMLALQSQRQQQAQQAIMEAAKAEQAEARKVLSESAAQEDAQLVSMDMQEERQMVARNMAKKMEEAEALKEELTKEVAHGNFQLSRLGEQLPAECLLQPVL
ncbi:unnamed protein product, partial [Effrenium voratum]